jgi:hypothetical protein
VIWEPFVLALVLGLIISAGLYFAYLWPSVEPIDRDDDPVTPGDGGAGQTADPARLAGQAGQVDPAAPGSASPAP